MLQSNFFFKSDNKTSQHKHDFPLHVFESFNKTLQHEHDVFAIFYIVQ